MRIVCGCRGAVGRRKRRQGRRGSKPKNEKRQQLHCLDDAAASCGVVGGKRERLGQKRLKASGRVHAQQCDQHKEDKVIVLKGAAVLAAGSLSRSIYFYSFHTRRREEEEVDPRRHTSTRLLEHNKNPNDYLFIFLAVLFLYSSFFFF